MKKEKSASIKTQLQMAFLILIVIPIIILGIYSYLVAKKNLMEQTEVAMRGGADVIAYGIDNNAKREEDVVKLFSYEEDLRTRLLRASEDPYALTEELTNNIEPLVWYYIGSDNNIESINFYSELLPQDHIGEFMSVPKDETIKGFYEICRNDYSAKWVMDDDGGVYVIKSLVDFSTSSRVIGMVVLKVKKEFFFSIVNQSSYLNNGIIIKDNNNLIITRKPLKDEKLDDEIEEAILSGALESEDDNYIETDQYLLIATGHTSNGWQLFYYIDRDEMVGDVLSIMSTVIVLALVIFILAYFIASIYATRLSKRITKLDAVAHEIRNGNFDVTIDDNRMDEIGSLSDSMEDMAQKLRDMVDEINRRNQEDILAKESDIHYREWLFDFVVEKNNDILAVVNEDDFSCNFITQNAEGILGIPLTDLQSNIKNLAKAQREDSEVMLDEVIEESARTGEVKVLDELRFQNLVTAEHLYYKGVVICTIDDGGKRMAISLYDITQQIKRNHQLQEALQSAETANKAKTSFLANMSHDFRTPMNAITGFNLLIDKHSEEPEKVREYTHKISLASHNLLALLNDVLDMSKIESGKTTLDIKEMAIGLLLEEINSVISFQAKAKNQEYIVRTEEMEHDMFMGDKQRINEILMNILGNAVKYTPEGGRIEFIINESPSSSEGFQNVQFTIRDNGIGMKPEYKDKIFEAFSREEKGSTKTIQGTGLGMAITKSLVELMGGTIRVDSEEGKGSTFIVNLRLKVVDEADVDFWKGYGISTVMIIATMMKDYEQIINTFETDNVEVIEAKDGHGALHVLDKYNSEKKNVDLIIVDDKPEDMPVAELIEEIRAGNKNGNDLIIVAAEDIASIEDSVREAGTNDIVQKPLFASSLKQTMQDIAGRSAVSEAQEITNPLEGMKFLAAEDNDINADILTELMSMEGATVTRGCNGQEVVEMFKAAKEGDYDMILMDIQMPIMNGYEAAAAIRSLQSDWAQTIPIIAMTANAYADDVQQAFDAGMNAHVSKPIDIKLVEKTILEFKK